MLILLAAVIAAGLALARGGSLRDLAATHFDHVWLLVTSLVLQVALDVWDPAWLGEGAGQVLLAISYAGVVAFLILNRRLPGVTIAAVGLAMNALVISLNGAMPVSDWALRSAGGTESVSDQRVKHEPLDDDTILPIFADLIPVPGAGQVISLGDVVLGIGLARLVYARTRVEPRHSVRRVSG